MKQPESFVVHGKEKKVWELVKSIYELKQEPKQWDKKFDQTMLANGFKNDGSDICVHIKVTRSIFVYILVICWSSLKTLITSMLQNIR